MYTTLLPLAAAKANDAGFDWTPAWTLGGVVTTGAFVLVGHGMVQRAARKQAAIQADRDLSRWHRELRRQSYVDCIVTYERMRDMLVPLARAVPWPVSRPLTDEEATHVDALLVTLGERYDEAFQKCQVVRLEGPGSIADSAQRLILAAASFRNAADRRAEAARAGERPSDTPAWNASAEEMNDELDVFIEAARAVIAVD
ncbi:hypothetical protein OG345_40760 (plasmid) [Streptomyces sp. NBC_01220]|uniref:hypothetical protein n=1 Tax=Streptomyces sp. NBC_01220 TaxID=2903781 RepID=UPI00352F70C1|nr:hypothetical protein OG345_40760 [Streptomyces sp. NBC_01220]